jgi:hypothetical protein
MRIGRRDGLEDEPPLPGLAPPGRFHISNESYY